MEESIDEMIRKAKELRSILKECKDLQEPVEILSGPVEIKSSCCEKCCRRCCDCPHVKRSCDPIWLYEPWRITCGPTVITSSTTYSER